MFNKFRKFTCILLTLVMVVSLAACGKSEEDSGDVDVSYVYEYEYQSGTQNGDSTNDGVNSSNTTSNNNSSNKNGSSSNKGSSNNKNTSNDALKKLKGTTVKFATWKDPALNEDGPVVEAFQKKYGIKVEIVPISQGTYTNTIQGLIASGQSPDVYFSNGDFPACLSCLQPISATKINMKEDIWDQATFNMTKFNGESYLCNTVGNIWNETDLLFYNKSLWKQAGINSTPAEFDKAGKWNWDTLEQIMTAVSKLKNRAGAKMDVAGMVGSTGNSIFLLENGKFKSGLDNSSMTAVMKKLASWKQTGLTSGTTDAFVKGNVGIIITNAFGLKRTGYFSDANWDNLGFYYIPAFDSKTKATETGIFRGWGLIRGAKNPEGAGAFLRYYLDVNNYDTSEAFVSEEAKSFFFQLTTGQQNKKTPYFTYADIMDSIAGVDSGAIYDIANRTAPDQVSAKLSTFKNSVTAGAKKINDYVNKNIGKK